MRSLLCERNTNHIENVQDLLKVVRTVWRNKAISAAEALAGAKSLQHLNDYYMSDSYTRQSFLCCGVVPFLSPLLKLAALQQHTALSHTDMSPLQLSLLTTLSYVFIHSSGKSPKPVEVRL